MRVAAAASPRQLRHGRLLLARVRSCDLEDVVDELLFSHLEAILLAGPALKERLYMRHHHKYGTLRAAEHPAALSAVERALAPIAPGRLIWFRPGFQCRQLGFAAEHDARVPTGSPRIACFVTPEDTALFARRAWFLKTKISFWRSIGEDLCRGKGVFPHSQSATRALSSW